MPGDGESSPCQATWTLGNFKIDVAGRVRAWMLRNSFQVPGPRFGPGSLMMFFTVCRQFFRIASYSRGQIASLAWTP